MNSSAPSPRSEADPFAARRNEVRSGMLRANRALGLLLAVVLVLASVAMVFIHRSGTNQVRAEQAEAEAKERLWSASIAQARAERTSPRAGRRAAALEAVRAAAAIRTSVELRNEAIAALRLPDFEEAFSWPAAQEDRGIAFDPDLEYNASRTTSGDVVVRRMSDNSVVRRLSRPPEVPADSAVMDHQFSATGKYLAVQYDKGVLVLFDRESGETTCVLGADERVSFCTWPPSFTADDSVMGVMMKGADGIHLLYDIAAREPRRPAVVPAKLVFRGVVNQALLSPKGDSIAWYEGTAVYVIDAVSGAVGQEITGPAAVRSLDWDQRGERFAFGCSNSTHFIVEARSGRAIQLGGRTIQPVAQRFSEDGRLLLTAGLDGLTSLWDVSSARLLCQSGAARGVGLSKSGDRIGWGIPRSRIGIWKVGQPCEDVQLQGRYTHGATLWQQDFSFDGAHALWVPPTWLRASAVELYDVESARTAVLRTERRVSAGFIPGSKQLWFTAPDALTIHDWPDLGQLPAAGLPEVRRIPLPGASAPVMASFSADGKHVAAACEDGSLYAVDAETPGAARLMEQGVRFTKDVPGPGSASGSGALAISPDGKWIVAGRDTVTRDPAVWEAATGRLVMRLPCPAAHVSFSPDGSRLITVGTGHLRMWSVPDWKEVWSRERRVSLADFLGAAAFSGDSGMLAWTSDLDVIEIVSPGDGVALASFKVPELYPVTGLRFSRDGGRLFATGPEGKMQIINAGALRRDHLAPLGLDWPSAPKAAGLAGQPGGTAGWLPALTGFISLAVAAVLGVALFRRHTRLASEFMDAVQLASVKERELEVERELGELKSRFVTTVSHEFRTPLGITMSAVELLRHYEDRLPVDEKKQLFDDIHGATKGMAGLMEQVLVLGRVDAGKLACKPGTLDIEVLARKLTDESLSATNRKCTIEWAAENDLSGACADESLLRHILTNLLSNGVKYSPEGSTVHFSARREGAMAVFTVKDSGIGIPEADMPKLFEAFHRGSNVGDIPGTGLGLVIIKRCVDLHRGSISVQSRPGEGTTFTIRIPAWD